MDASKLGAFIRKCRMEKGLTQGQLGAAIHVTDKAISRWERGIGFPDVKLLKPLAEALGLSLEELMQCQRAGKDGAERTQTAPWWYRYRRVWAVLCFLIYSLVRVMRDSPVLASQTFWMSPASKLLFAATGIALLLSSYRDKRFDPWLSVPVCAAWLLKCGRTIYYDWFSTAIRDMETNEAFLLAAKAQQVTAVMDVLTELLLCAAILRILITGWFWYRYRKTVKAFNK